MDMCDDNRLELIERYKKQLVESTNIESSPDEMAVIDNILFRFWQMGWLKEHVRCKECKYWRQLYGDRSSVGCCDCDDMWRSLDGETTEVSNIITDSDFYCGYAERR